MRSAVRTPVNVEQWHRWFAWRPIRVPAGESNMWVWVWWEYVERVLEGHYDGYTAKYRLLKNDPRR